MNQVRWGLLSTAATGATVVDACRGSETVRFSAVASRDSGRASAFAANHGLTSAFGSYEELACDEVDDGAIGRLFLVRTALTVDVPEGDIRRTRSLGGGALGDLGCYGISGPRYFGEDPDAVYRLELEPHRSGVTA